MNIIVRILKASGEIITLPPEFYSYEINPVTKDFRLRFNGTYTFEQGDYLYPEFVDDFTPKEGQGGKTFTFTVDKSDKPMPENGEMIIYNDDDTGGQ